MRNISAGVINAVVGIFGGDDQHHFWALYNAKERGFPGLQGDMYIVLHDLREILVFDLGRDFTEALVRRVI